MARGNSGPCVHKSGFTSRDIKKLTVSAVLVCVFVPGKGCGRLEDSSSVNPVVWGFESIACRLLSLWEVGWPVEMVDMARTGTKTVKR